MNIDASFSFDGNLITQIAKSYRSTAEAIKELVTNAWDAEAEAVYISLPKTSDEDKIIIEDDGNGMTLKEIQSDFLNIGFNGKLRRGEITPTKKEKLRVKGG